MLGEECGGRPSSLLHRVSLGRLIKGMSPVEPRQRKQLQSVTEGEIEILDRPAGGLWYYLLVAAATTFSGDEVAVWSEVGFASGYSNPLPSAMGSSARGSEAGSAASYGIPLPSLPRAPVLVEEVGDYEEEDVFGHGCSLD